ncbi:MAG: hypothetical protein JHC98_00250 [Thermoleophilaceae bacterium]|nr:hypothetical protein [Thermoleophilaceae bacterium]
MTHTLFSSILAVTEAAPPAGGAALKEIIIATLMGGIAFGGVVFLALGHRSGKIHWLQTAGDFAGRQLSLPAWAALPLVVLTGSLIAAVFGLYWDVSLHLSKGRDAGPLANPSHYFILVGLLGCFSAGVLALTMPKPGTKPSPWSVKLAEGWYAPVGGLLIAISAAFGLAGFPLDDFWHRMFGQDVTLWGPTHLLMLTGAGLCLIGASVLLIEGGLATDRKRGNRELTRQEKLIRTGRRAMSAGGLLVALCIYMGEFDFGIAQFQQVFHPLMVMFAAGVALTYARSTAGRGGAILAVLFYLLVRGLLTLIVSDVFGRPEASFPLFLGCAIAVELAALAMGSRVYTKPMQFAIASGAAIGTLGLATEWAWTNVWGIYPWTSALLPEGAIIGFIAAVAGAFIGAWMANSLMLRPRPMGALRYAPVASVLVMMVMIGYGLHQYSPKGLEAQLTNTPAATPPGETGKWVNTTIKLNSDYFDTDRKWAKSIAWQGPGFVVNDLKQTGPGTFETTEPIPAYGKWKSMVRFHKDSSLMGVAVFEPLDAAIPAAEVPAAPQVTRDLRPDRVILQREAKFEGGWLTNFGYFLLFAIAMSLLGLLAWGIQRVSTPLTEEQGATEDEVEKASRPPATRSASSARPLTPRDA